MSRCKACDTELPSLSVKKLDSQGVDLEMEEDLCTACLGHSYSKYNILTDKEYQFPELETDYSDLFTYNT